MKLHKFVLGVLVATVTISTAYAVQITDINN